MFTAFLGKNRKAIAMRLYNAAVAQARLPVFYKDLRVPDTLDGRFDLLSLHVFLIVNRLNKGGRGGVRLAQSLFDMMFIDMDRSLREMGVGDLGVPKQMKRMMKGFNGRCAAYETALKSSVQNDLCEALRRNIYGTLGHGIRLDPVMLAAVEGYVRDAGLHLTGLTDADVLSGHVDFPAVVYEDASGEHDLGMVA